MSLDERSRNKLAGVQPALVRVVLRAAQESPIRFIVTEGVRTVMRQAELVEAGASQTMNSRHLTGEAVDLAPLVGGEVRWDWPLFYRLADAMQAAARTEGVLIEWGGAWRRFKDGPHFQLARGQVAA